MNNFALSSPAMSGMPAPAPSGPMIPPPANPIALQQMLAQKKPVPVNSLRGKASHKLKNHPAKAAPKKGK